MKTIFLSILCTLCFVAVANFNVYEFEGNAEQEQQFNQLIHELRCPKCQNNNLADSNAPLAADIKNVVYQSVKAGKSSEEITDFLIARYGEFITYRPRNDWLWVLPFALGLLGLGIAVWAIKRRRLAAHGVITTPTDNMAKIIREYETEREHRRQR